MKGAARTRMTVVVIVGVLLAAIAWWRWPAAAAQSNQASAPALEGRTRRAGNHQLMQRRIHVGNDQWVDMDLPPPDAATVRCNQDQRRQMQARIDRLGQPVTEQDSIEHAFLTGMIALQASSGDANATSREYQAARKRWPDNLDLAWFSLHHCATALGCDRDQEWRHLLAIDPDNAATWIQAMELSWERRDEVAYDDALHRAANAKIYDPRLGAAFLYLYPLLLELPPPASCIRPQDIAGLTTALG